VSDDPNAETEQQEDWRKALHAPGSEFVPEPGKMATKEQIAGFYETREGPKKWTPEESKGFYDLIDNLGRKDPNHQKIELRSRTDRMEADSRNDLAKQMSPDQIRQGLDALDLPERRQQFDKKLALAEADQDGLVIEKLCKQEALAVLEIDDHRKYEAYHKRPNADANAKGNDNPNDPTPSVGGTALEALKPDDDPDPPSPEPAASLLPPLTPEQQVDMDRLLEAPMQDRGSEEIGIDAEPTDVPDTERPTEADRTDSFDAEVRAEDHDTRDVGSAEVSDGTIGEMTEEQRARFEKLIEIDVREAGNELTHHNDGSSRGGRHMGGA
jgi:hypothetical protein